MSLKQKGTDSLVPLFAGFCFFLSSIELMIPKPVPFFRMGLANLPILIGINVFSFPTFLVLLIIKVLGQALISGTIFSYITLFAAVSTFSAGMVMYTMKNIPKRAISFIGISVAGAFVSNTTQIILAIFIIFGKSTLYAAPPIYTFGMVTSILLGIFANKFTRDSIWYKKVISEPFNLKPIPYEETDKKLKNDNFLRLSSGLLLFCILLFVNFLPSRALILGLALILCVIDRQKINFLGLIIMFIAILVFNLYPPSGKIILRLGNITITNEALLRGIEKAVILQSMIYISKWMLKAKIHFKSNIGLEIQSAQAVFSKLLTVKKEIHAKNLIPSLDAILLSINKL